MWWGIAEMPDPFLIALVSGAFLAGVASTATGCCCRRAEPGMDTVYLPARCVKKRSASWSPPRSHPVADLESNAARPHQD